MVLVNLAHMSIHIKINLHFMVYVSDKNKHIAIPLKSILKSRIKICLNHFNKHFKKHLI